MLNKIVNFFKGGFKKVMVRVASLFLIIVVVVAILWIVKFLGCMVFCA